MMRQLTDGAAGGGRREVCEGGVAAGDLIPVQFAGPLLLLVDARDPRSPPLALFFIHRTKSSSQLHDVNDGNCMIASKRKATKRKEKQPLVPVV